MPGQIIIKKYSNRRLYDTTNKKYVNLEDISALIREGNEIKVIDTQTGEDISKLILIQVVLESEKNKEDILPVSFLHMLIKYGNKIARDFFENSFLMMFQPYLSFQDSIKKNLKIWKDTGLLPEEFKFPMPFGTKSPFDMLGEEIERKYEPDKTSKNEEPKKAATSDELEYLMDKVKELEEKIESIDKSK